MAKAKERFGSLGTMSRDDAAGLLRSTPRYVDLLIRREKVWAKKDGRRILIDTLSVHRYLENLPSPNERPKEERCAA